MHTILPAVLATAALLAMASAAQAQSDTAAPYPKSRIGTEWGGKKHPPPAAEVRQREQAQGVGVNPQQDQQLTNEVERLHQEILQRARQDLRERPPSP
jgi:Spy/CpxP family protein refolding chaperone